MNRISGSRGGGPAQQQGQAQHRHHGAHYVHVITPDGVTGNVPDHKIRDQINVLDLTYGGFYGGYATGFDFELVGITRTINEAWYNTGPSTAAEQ